MPEPRLRQTRRSLPIAPLRARARLMEPIRDMLARGGVSEPKWRVLRVLDQGGAMDLTRLATESCLLLPSPTRMVGPMQAGGLIATERPAADRRRVVVAITDRGRALLARHAAESAAIFARIEAQFGLERLEALLDLLEHLRGLDLRRGRGGDGLG